MFDLQGPLAEWLDVVRVPIILRWLVAWRVSLLFFVACKAAIGSAGHARRANVSAVARFGDGDFPSGKRSPRAG